MSHFNHPFLLCQAQALAPPNDLRIDAAEEEKVKTAKENAAASVLVELSCTPKNSEQLLGD